MAPSALQSRYLSNTVETVSPARLVTMLYDALVRDLSMAETAIDGRRVEETNDRLVHAQAILFELRASLKLDGWAGAAGLAQLYTFLLSELLTANVRKDRSIVASCRVLVEPLQQAWHDAAARIGGVTSVPAPA